MECIKPNKNDQLDGIGGSFPLDSKPPSLSSLVAWNISKVQENHPELDIKDAIVAAQCRLEQDAHEIDAILSENPYMRYLSCALLAWQQLGHNNVDSLCRFVENKKEAECAATSVPYAASTVVQCSTVQPRNSKSISRESTLAKAVKSTSFYSNEMGPVVKLPVETTIVMRVGSGPPPRCHGLKKTKAPEKNIMDKIDKACCLDSRCSKHLMAMDKSIKELKDRVVTLARREADRIELIERAEAAWRDLELGYQRRLRRAEEKEADLAKQIEKAIAERAVYKDDCPPMAEQLKSMSGLSEKDNARLNDTEKVLYTLACERVKLSQECAKGDAVVTECGCKGAQLDRDLQFKEEQARRKVQSLKSELDSASAITHDTERALRADLNSLRDQLSGVSKQLLAEDAETDKIKLSIDDLSQEKTEILEDLEGCKIMCEGRMKELIDEVKSKSEKLASLKDKALECRCKVPTDANVEVKRTPSLAVLCKCTPTDRLKTSCSCTSMRGRLMSDVLADLFGGLQAEMGMTVTMMPCQLLKCLEEKHDWDKVTPVKTSLKNYFSNLLVGELDIAIATSIEKYHAKWVGTSCADDASPDTRDADIERRAKNLASQLAEQLFEEKSEELEKRAKDLIASGPPPCNCKPTTIANAAIQSKALSSLKNRPASFISPDSATPTYWYQAIRDVTQLRQQVQDLQKDSLKKEDLKTMENKFAKMIRSSAVPKAVSAWKEEADWRDRPWKKYFNRSTVIGADEKAIDGKAANVGASHAVAFPCLTKNRPAANVVPVCETPSYLHEAMQDVAQLRQLVESLEKDSLKKEDLKMMEEKFSKIIQRATESRSPTSAKAVNSTSVNVNKVVGLRSKVQKINRAVNHSGLNIFDNINISTTSKRNDWDTNIQIKKRRSFIKHGIDKTFTNRTNENTYAVNMCLCNTKKRQHIPKNTVSPKLSSMKSKSKPISTNHLAQNLNRHNSNDLEEQTCPINCCCFHKIPSTISIDQLVDSTFAKWKNDLDASCNDQLTRKNSKDARVSVKSKTKEKIHNNPFTQKGSDDENIGLNNDENVSLKSKTNVQILKELSCDTFTGKISEDRNLNFKFKNLTNNKSSEKSRNSEFTQKISEDEIIFFKSITKDLKPIQKTVEKKHESLNVQSSIPKNDLNKIKSHASKTSKNSERHCGKSTDPVEITLSEYMGAVNLDKSNEEVFKSVNIANKDLDDIIFEGTHTKKEKYNDFSGHQRNKKGHQMKEITVLRNTEKTKERQKSQYHEKTTSNQLNDTKTNANTIDACDCDYQIKFLGVTLADINPPITNKIFVNKGNDSYYNKNIVTNNTVPQEENNLDKNKIGTELDQNEAHPDKTNTDQYATNIKFKKNPSKKYQVNISDSINIDEMNMSANTFNAIYKNMRPGKALVSEMYSNVFEQKERMLEDKDIITDHSRLSSIKNGGPSGNHNMRSCQCSVNLADIKNLLKGNFENQVANEDIALDVQSFKHLKNKDETCVCCDSLNTDESKNLEDNAFHLLEEYLKKKLDEFKATSCSSLCIPPMEEEKLFTVILQRVKQLIADSTNEITCKCLPDQVKSQGSWNRAYGLLQEYLKIKIQKVQCSCLLAEDNKDTLLPNVLDKVSHLIECDFQRLKDVCGCKNDSKTQENTDGYLKCLATGNFRQEVPEKDGNVTLFTSRDNAIYHQTKDDTIRNNVNQEQVAVENITKNVNIQASARSLNKYRYNTIGSQTFSNTRRVYSNPDQETVVETSKNVNMQASSCSLNKYKDNPINLDTIDDPISDNANQGQKIVETIGENIKVYTKCTYKDCNCVAKILEAQLSGTQLNENNEKYDIVNVTNDQIIFDVLLLDTRVTENNEKYDTVAVTEEQKFTQCLTNSDDDSPKCTYSIESSTNDNTKIISCTNNASTIASVNLGNEHATDDQTKQSSMFVSYNLKQKANAEITDNVKQSASHTNTQLILPSDSSKINNIDSKHYDIKRNNEKTSLTQMGNSVLHDSYNGDCEKFLDICDCSKSKTSIADMDKVTNNSKRSIPDKICLEEVSYVVNNERENLKSIANLQIDMSKDIFLQSILKKNTVKDTYFNKCLTTLSSSNPDCHFVLKKSIENISKAHAKVNTLEDITSVNNNYSINEDGCEYNTDKHLDSEQLKNSLYFPAPIITTNDFRNDTLTDDIFVNPINELPKHVCKCEMVPICHVKMLVENIETKLANAKCTCDSLIPQVCPVHSRK